MPRTGKLESSLYQQQKSQQFHLGMGWRCSRVLYGFESYILEKFDLFWNFKRHNSEKMGGKQSEALTQG